MIPQSVRDLSNSELQSAIRALRMESPEWAAELAELLREKRRRARRGIVLHHQFQLNLSK